jgi:hypothetical protein
MEIKLKKLFIVILSVIALNAVSQTPGYMGKRFSAGYGFYASPALLGSSGLSALNMLHEGYVEFAVKKKFSMGLSARFYNAEYANNREVFVNAPQSNSSYSYQQIDPNPSGATHIKGRNYLLYFKFFRNNYIAPWGKYFILGASLNTFTSSYDPTDMKLRFSYNNYSSYGSVNTDTYFSNFGPTEQSYTRFDVMLGFGRCRVIANRITIDYGYNINLLAMGLTLFDAPDDNILDSDVLTDIDYIERVSAARVRGVNRFNIFCKIGVLLF